MYIFVVAVRRIEQRLPSGWLDFSLRPRASVSGFGFHFGYIERAGYAFRPSMSRRAEIFWGSW
jgi:hypothetical protein